MRFLRYRREEELENKTLIKRAWTTKFKASGLASKNSLNLIKKFIKMGAVKFLLY